LFKTTLTRNSTGFCFVGGSTLLRFYFDDIPFTKRLGKISF